MMEDTRIIELYFERSEQAIIETAHKYGSYCRCIANNILHNKQEVEECLDDTYMQAWDSIPPHIPTRMKTYLGKITRNLAINRYLYNNAAKRKLNETYVIIEELNKCIPPNNHTERIVDDCLIKEILNSFLEALPIEQRKIFVRRYWYMDSVTEIARANGVGVSKVKMILHRTKKKLKQMLEEEGVSI